MNARYHQPKTLWFLLPLAVLAVGLGVLSELNRSDNAMGFSWPIRFLLMEGLADRVAYARFLHDGSEVQLRPPKWFGEQLSQYGRKESTLLLSLPIKRPDVVVPVIELSLKE